MRRNNVAVREIMSKFDAAESGRMTEEEFAAAMAEVGGKMAQDSLYDIMAHAEGVKSDTVTYREWFSGLEREVTERDVCVLAIYLLLSYSAAAAAAATGTTAIRHVPPLPHPLLLYYTPLL